MVKRGKEIEFHQIIKEETKKLTSHQMILIETYFSSRTILLSHVLGDNIVPIVIELETGKLTLDEKISVKQKEALQSMVKKIELKTVFL